jgi:hypothetical protein
MCQHAMTCEDHSLPIADPPALHIHELLVLGPREDRLSLFGHKP